MYIFFLKIRERNLSFYKLKKGFSLIGLNCGKTAMRKFGITIIGVC